MRWLALALLLFIVGCGGDEEPAAVSTPTFTSTAAATAEAVRTEPRITATTPEPQTTTLGATDNTALDVANQGIGEYCGAVLEGREPTENQRAQMEFAIEAFLDVLGRDPEAIWVPPARPENTRTVRQAVVEAVEFLRTEDCAPAQADRLEAAL